MSAQRGKPGARSSARSSAAGGRSPVVLGLFIALFVLLFAGFAVAQGIGQPSIPSDAVAVIEDTPDETTTVTDCHGDEVEDDLGTITEAEFDCALQQNAARAGLPKTPKPGDEQYEDLRTAAMSDLLDTIWVQSEAAERGIDASPREVSAELSQIVLQNFRCDKTEAPFACPEFKQFMERSRLTRDDVLLRVRLQIISDDLRNSVGTAASVSADQVEDYYQAAKGDLFTQPPSRTIRLVLNKDRAKTEEAKARLEEDDSVKSWREVAKQLSTDPASKDNGGLRPGLVEGLVEEPLNKEVFSAPEGELTGPVKTPLGYYVFQVEKIVPERVQPLSEVQQQIRNQLTRTAQQEAFTAFVDDYGSRWQARTFCAEDYLIERCANFKGTGHPSAAPPACYEENPRRGRPDACPAPVQQLVPALPGTVSALAPRGVQLPQRPQPAGLESPPPSGTLPGSGGGVVPTP